MSKQKSQTKELKVKGDSFVSKRSNKCIQSDIEDHGEVKDKK